MGTVLVWLVWEKCARILQQYCSTWKHVSGDHMYTRKCQWVIPKFQKEIPYAPVQELDFTSAQAKKKKIDEAIQDENEVPNTNQGSAGHASSTDVHDLDCSRPTEVELRSFFVSDVTDVPKGK